jgi:membrane fusion protein, multidrug efflux system
MNQPGGQTPATPNAPGTPKDQSIDDVPIFKRKRAIIPLFVVLLAVLGGGTYWYVGHAAFITTDDAFIDADRAAISSKILGRVIALAADEGDTVHKGDTIVRLDNSDLLAQEKKAEANIRFLTRSAQIAGVNLAKARDDYERTEKQFKSQVVSQEQFSHAENTRKLQEAQEEMAYSQIATAQADLAIVRTAIGNTVISAPFSGVIAKRWVYSGDVVQPGQAIFSMYNNGREWVTANFEETKLQRIRPGAHAEITIDAYPGKVFKGTVLSIGRSTAAQFSLIPPNNASGNFTKITQRVPVKISLDDAENSKAPLLPGFSVVVRITAQ